MRGYSSSESCAAIAEEKRRAKAKRSSVRSMKATFRSRVNSLGRSCLDFRLHQELYASKPRLVTWACDQMSLEDAGVGIEKLACVLRAALVIDIVELLIEARADPAHLAGR